METQSWKDTAMKAGRRIAELEAEIEDISAERLDEYMAYKACQEDNAALWAFVRAYREVSEWISSRNQQEVGLDEWHVEFDARIKRFDEAHEALRQYEEQKG